MQIRTIRTKFKAIECKFEPFERDSKQSNENSNHSKGILTIRMQIRIIRTRFEAMEWKFKPFERNSNHSNELWSIGKDLKQWNANWNHLKGILTIRMRFEAFERDSNHSNANSKEFRSNRIQIRTIRKGF